MRFVNRPGWVRCRHMFLLLAPLVLGSIAIPAARSDAAGAAPSADEVAAGLKAIQRTASEVAQNTGKNNAIAVESSREIEPAWKKIEDVVRTNDKNSYVAIEKAVSDLAAAAKASDANRASDAAAAFTTAANSYTANHPAPGSTAAPAPAAESSTTTAAPSSITTPPAARAAAGAPETTKAEAPAPAKTPAPAVAAAAGDATLARTGKASSALTALAGAAFGLGGLAFIGGARRRRSATL